MKAKVPKVTNLFFYFVTVLITVLKVLLKTLAFSNATLLISKIVPVTINKILKSSILINSDNVMWL